MGFIQFGEHSLLMSFVFVSTGVNFRYEQIEVGIWTQRPFGDQLFAASGTLFVAGPQSSDDAVGAEAVEALLRRHRLLEHVEAYGAHQLRVEAARGHGDLRGIRHGVLGSAVEFVEGKFP